MSDYDGCVKQGAALLDHVRPGWAAWIATDRLAMESSHDDILGQLYGDFHEGFRAAMRPLPASMLFAASEFGFTLPDEDQQDNGPETMARFGTLADAWRAEIRRRLDGGGADRCPTT